VKGSERAKAYKAEAVRAAVTATNPFELVERGLPPENALVAWRGPWRYYKAVAFRASAANGDHPEGTVTSYAVGEFTVRTNHEKAEGRPRSAMGLVMTRGSRQEPPETYEQLKGWIGRSDMAPTAELTPHRPELPPFKMQEIGGSEGE